MEKTDILELLKEVIHPEQGKDIVSMDMVHDLAVEENQDGKTTDVRFTLKLTKPRDPMANSIRRAAEGVIQQATGVMPTIIVSEATAAPHKSPEERMKEKSMVTGTDKKVKHIIAIASGKGGVGKSTVTANLAVALAEMGYKTGVLDADIYGPSVPKMFGVEDYKPMVSSMDGQDVEYILPAEAYGVKLMSIGFFIDKNDALVWRGPMATNALKQLLHQTDWGELDYLLIDLPPGTGDLHLTLISELKLTGAIIVSTPQEVAMIDVVRGISMFKNEHVNVPILGIVENMAWFTPKELPDHKYRIFGPSGSLEEGGRVARLAQEQGVPFLGSVPLVQGIAESGDSGKPGAENSDAFRSIAKSVAK